MTNNPRGGGPAQTGATGDTVNQPPPEVRPASAPICPDCRHGNHAAGSCDVDMPCTIGCNAWFTCECKTGWPSRDEFRRMTPAEVNGFAEATGLGVRVVEAVRRHSPSRPDQQGMRWCLVCDEDWPCVSARITPSTPVPPPDPSF